MGTPGIGTLIAEAEASDAGVRGALNRDACLAYRATGGTATCNGQRGRLHRPHCTKQLRLRQQLALKFVLQPGATAAEHDAARFCLS